MRRASALGAVVDVIDGVACALIDNGMPCVVMALGDVAEKPVPKMTLVSAPRADGVIATRSFIPHRVHATIGVFAAVSVATACTLPDTPAARLAALPADRRFRLEHPSGEAEVLIERDASGAVTGAGTMRAARKLFDGQVFPHA